MYIELLDDFVVGYIEYIELLDDFVLVFFLFIWSNKVLELKL